MKISHIFLTLSLAVILNGCSRSQSKTSEPLPPEVNVSTPVTREITDLVEFTGHTEAVNSIVVRAMVTGYLDKVLFKEGDEVAENARLFKIDPQIYEAQLAQARANRELAQEHLKRLEADLRRAKSLLPGKAISQEDFDKVEGDRNEAKAGVGVAEAAEKLAQQNVDYTTITAKIGGRISRQMIDPGNMVRANDTPLTSIVSLDTMYAYFDIDERTMLQIRRLVRAGKVRSAHEGDTKIRLGLADEEGFPHVGTINFIDNQVDVPTGTLRLRGLFPNPNRILSPGMFVRIRVPIGDPHQSLLVSERALGSDQGQKFLYVLNDKDEVAYRRVEVGALNDGLRVIQSGLKAGERVILSGLQRVRPGMKVNAKNIAMAPKDLPASAAAGAPAVSPGAAPVSPTGTSGMPAAPQNNPIPPAIPKSVDQPRLGVKSAAISQNRWDF
ncbi:MAG: efflux RND transporter periplasmic adaptor subunit [Planctomycetota bacterium]